MDEELNLIFSECHRDSSDVASSEELASICARTYAPSDSGVRDQIRQVIDPDGCLFISKSDFFNRMKGWVNQQTFSPRNDIVYSSHPSEEGLHFNQCATSTPTTGFRSIAPLQKRLDVAACESESSSSPSSEAVELLRNKVVSLEESLSASKMKAYEVKQINSSLEARISVTEQMNHSLEAQVRKLNEELKNKILCSEKENKQLTQMLTDSEAKVLSLTRELDEVNAALRSEMSYNAKLRSDLESCTCAQLRTKYEELRLELEETNARNLAIRRENDVYVERLTAEFAVQIQTLNEKNSGLSSSHAELVSVLEELRAEKQALQSQLDEALPNRNFPGIINSDERRESGISVRSYEPISGSLWNVFGNSTNGRSDEESTLADTYRYVDSVSSQTDQWTSHRNCIEVRTQTDESSFRISTQHASTQTEQPDLIRTVATTQTDGFRILETNDSSTQADQYPVPVRSDATAQTENLRIPPAFSISTEILCSHDPNRSDATAQTENLRIPPAFSISTEILCSHDPNRNSTSSQTYRNRTEAIFTQTDQPIRMEIKTQTSGKRTGRSGERCSCPLASSSLTCLLLLATLALLYIICKPRPYLRYPRGSPPV